MSITSSWETKILMFPCLFWSYFSFQPISRDKRYQVILLLRTWNVHDWWPRLLINFLNYGSRLYIFLPILYMLIQNSEILLLAAKPQFLLYFSIYIIFMQNNGRNPLLKYKLFVRSIPNISNNLLCWFNQTIRKCISLSIHTVIKLKDKYSN